MAACRSLVKRWHLFERYNLLKSTPRKTFRLDEDAFAHFLLDLPGCDDPVSDLKALIDYWVPFQGESFHFAYITADIFVNEVIAMMDKKCPGYDGVGITQVYEGLPFLVPILSDLFNRILDTGEHPDAWKLTTVRPIPKIFSPSEVSHFRRIAP